LKISDLLAFFVRYRAFFKATAYIQQPLASVLSSITMLIVDLVIHHVEGGASAETQTELVQTVSNLDSHKDIFVNEVWRIKLERGQGAGSECSFCHDRPCN